MKRALLSIEDDGGIVTVRYVERCTRSADEFFKDCDESDEQVVQRKTTESLLRTLPDSQLLLHQSGKYSIANMLYECGPMPIDALRKELDVLGDSTFRTSLKWLLEEGIIYVDGEEMRLDTDWLEGYLSDFMEMP
jgi:hypothetical protein